MHAACLVALGERVATDGRQPPNLLVDIALSGLNSELTHIPVLPGRVRDLLPSLAGQTVLDVTVGAGGHAKILAESLGSTGLLIGLDVDKQSLARTRELLADAPCRMVFVRANFRQVKGALSSIGIAKVDVLLADLGISSAQLDDRARGFSFLGDGPLDMRFDLSSQETATDLVNGLKERELADLLYFNAQEMRSRRIAKRICEARRDGRITTTKRLVEIVCRAVGVRDPLSRRSRIHPATRTFLALRMAVNDEMGALNSLLEQAPDILNPDGRIGIISFHSVEDKAVKVDFRRRRSEDVYAIVTNKPVIADDEERRDNPRARSAKMRVAVRLPQGDQMPEQITA